ncbi:MAG: hypothetical protein ACLTLY_01810 [Agathobacter rectalis]
MDSKDNELARTAAGASQTVSRIKTGIIMTIAIWIAISILRHSCTGYHGCQTEFENIQALSFCVGAIAISSTVTGTGV